MPNLKEWVKAQLKKGYNKEEIKLVLSRKCYDKSIIEQVNRIAEQNRKVTSSLPRTLVIILIIDETIIKDCKSKRFGRGLCKMPVCYSPCKSENL